MSVTIDPRKLRVFVTDGFWRKTLAAVRGLGRIGVRVSVGESSLLAPSLLSRYSDRIVRTPSPVLNPSHYIEFMIDYLIRHPHDVLIPMEEDTQILISKHKTAFSCLTNIFVAHHECLSLIQDKLIVISQAESLGIPTPKTVGVPDVESGLSLVDRFSYPVVVKPRVGSGSAGVQYIETREALPPALRKAFQNGGAPLVQERLPREGSGIGASFLMDAGQNVLASFVHKRLREYPVGGGPSTLRESIVDERVREYGERLLRSFGFQGVAMVEFKVDSRDGTPKLLEVNPRFWGSLALAIDAGVNFPYLLTLAALGIPFEPVTSYKTGHRTRWLLPGDILHFIHNPGRWHLDPSFFRFIEPSLTYDIIDATDPWPIVGTLLSLWPYYRSHDFEHVRARR